MVSRRNLETRIELSLLVRKEEKQYVSWCPELDVSSCGESVEEACDNLYDAVDVYIRTLAEEGELPQVLQERGIKPVEDDETCSHVFLSSWQTGVTVPA